MPEIKGKSEKTQAKNTFASKGNIQSKLIRFQVLVELGMSYL